MKKVIYIVHIDVVSVQFDTLSNDDIKELYAKHPENVFRYDNLYDFAYDWNHNYEVLNYDPNNSYIRIIEEE